MGTTFQYSKTLTCEGAILLTLTVIPYVGWVLGIIGIILLMRGMKELANYYQDADIYQNSLTGVEFYVVAIIAAAVATAAIVVAVAAFVGIKGFPTFGIVAGAASITVSVVAIVVAFVFFILAASHLRKTFNTLAQKSGEQSFATAATLLWWGSWLTIIVIGFLVILIAWIFAVVGFFAMKPQQQSTNGYPSPPPTATQAPAGRYCSNCGAPVTLEATFCPRCGKQLVS